MVRADQYRGVAILMRAAELRANQPQHFVVTMDHGKATENHVRRRVVAAVVEARLVDDRGDAPEHRVGLVVPAEDCLETAVTRMVLQLGAGDVERGRARGASAGSDTKTNSASWSI